MTTRARSDFARHVLQLLTGTAAAQVVTLVAQVVALKIFADHTFGVFAAVTSVSATLVTIATLRYDLTVVLPSSDADGRRLALVCVRIAAAVCSVALVVLWLARHLVAAVLVRDTGQADLAERRLQVSTWLPWAAVLAFVVELGVIAGYWLNRKQMYTDMARAKVAQSTGVAVGQIGLGLLTPAMGSLVAGQFLGVGIGAAWQWRRAWASMREVTGAASAHLLRTYRRMPLLNGPTALFDAVRLNGINLVIASIWGLGDLGQFSRAWLLLQAPIALINGALQQVFYQQLAVTPRGRMAATVRRSIVRSAALGVVPFLVIWLAAPAIFTWWDAGWATAGHIAAALVPWLFCQFVTSPVSNVFLVVGAQAELMVFSAVFCVVGLAAFWWHQGDLVTSVWRVSFVMSGLLVGFCALTLLVAHRWDRGAQAEGPAGPAAPVEAVA